MERSTARSRLARAAVLLLAAGGLPAAASADVTTRERVALGGALGGLAGMSIETTTAIAGDRARIEARTECRNPLLRMLCPDPSAQIVRLDRDLTWQLDPQKRTWYEESFEDYRRRMDEAAAQAKAAQAGQPSAPEPDEARCEPQPARSDVQRSGEKAAFAGIQAERMTITVVQPCRDRESVKVCEARWVADRWIAPGDAAQAEQQRFWQAYARRLVRDEAALRTMAAPALAYLDRHRASFGELAKRLAEQEGMSLKSTLSLSFGGEGCGATAGATGTQAANGASRERPTLGRAIAGALGGGLFGRAKNKGADEPRADDAGAAPQSTAVFEMTSEVTAVDSAAVPAAQFEIPSGYERTSPPDPAGR